MKDEWMPIETAVEGDTVLAISGDEYFIAWLDEGQWWDMSGNNLNHDEGNYPTHWMVLPPPPKFAVTKGLK